jgi:hypothetical protein
MKAGVEQDFSITVIACEYASLSRKLCSQCAMVVDAAIEHDCSFAVVAEDGHGLVTAGVIDDRQSPMHHGDIDDASVVIAGSSAPPPASIGTAMHNATIDRVEPGIWNGGISLHCCIGA